jgi:hypothetical protein
MRAGRSGKADQQVAAAVNLDPRRRAAQLGQDRM